MIKNIHAREIIDSRGAPTVETEIKTSEGIFRGSAPSGASTGSAEARELRDGGKRLGGKGVLKAVRSVNKIISPTLINELPGQQKYLDEKMILLDGTPNKKKLGGNAIVSVSIALCKAGAAESGRPEYEYIARLAGTRPRLPLPLCNIINGGKHAGVEDDFQEHMIAPVGAKSFGQALEICVETYAMLMELMGRKGLNTSLVADEGGVVYGKTPNERLVLMEECSRAAGHAENVKFALDCAATQFFRPKQKKYFLNGKKMDAKTLSRYYEKLVAGHKIFSIEDPFAEGDWPAWKEFTKDNPSLQIVGDDLLATNPGRIRLASKEGACNALLVKPNQIGTVTEAIEAFKVARASGWNSIVSHRSGETEDVFASHLAVGLGCGQCKFGAPARGERTAKYNELTRISEKVRVFGVS